ncbi:hypothetical protein QJS10_CPA08g00061 [Acorus calamus]|uniref:CCHC-type domain-containing protein n=1 Tax=Acorus calamus TaxID=4465 RepID=A0AAV9EDL0_ACOCL|nr:hypothetical protein QJS10_CPA08g00061 [Acorus calamus]
MGQRGRWREKELESEDELDKSTVVMISSDDEGGANEDLTLAIVKKAKEREARRKRNVGDMDGTALVDLCSPSSAEEEPTPETATETEEVDGGGAAAEVGVAPAEEPRKKRRRKKKKKEPEIVCTPLKENDPVGSNDSVVTVANEVTDNAVMRSLLRGPRYFDPGDAPFGTCYKCGEEGHTMAQCTAEKKKKPCYVCGKTGHEAKRCTQGKDCYICKKRGHQAKNCPEKYERIPQDSKICLQCGVLGHEMFSCRNEYDPDDLKTWVLMKFLVTTVASLAIRVFGIKEWMNHIPLSKDLSRKVEDSGNINRHLRIMGGLTKRNLSHQKMDNSQILANLGRNMGGSLMILAIIGMLMRMVGGLPQHHPKEVIMLRTITQTHNLLIRNTGRRMKIIGRIIMSLRLQGLVTNGINIEALVD